MRTPPFRILAIACAVVFAAGIAAATTDGDESVRAAETATNTSDPSSISTTTLTEKGVSTPTTSDETPDPSAADPDTATEGTTPPPTGVPQTTTPASGTEAASVGTTPGSYVYDFNGTVNGEKVSGTSKLEVGAVGADGRQTHVQSAPDGKTTTVYRHAPEGTYLETLEIESDRGSFALTATAPFLVVPADAGPGTTTKGTMKGDDLTAQITFTIASVVGDSSTATLHVDLSGKVQGLQVEGTMDSTIVARTSDRLPLEVDAKSDITVGGGVFRVKSDTRSVLRQ